MLVKLTPGDNPTIEKKSKLVLKHTVKEFKTNFFLKTE